MPVTEYFTIVNLTVPSSWIALLTAFFITYAAIRIRYGKRISGVLVDAIFYFILVWKLSVIITDFGHVIKSPLSILYFNGGKLGFYLGIVAAGIAIYIELKKNGFHKLERIGLFTGLVTIQATYQILMVLLNEGALFTQFITIFMFALFAVYVWLSLEKMQDSFNQYALLLIAVHLFVAAFQPMGVFSTSVFATLLMSLYAVLFLFRGMMSRSGDNL